VFDRHVRDSRAAIAATTDEAFAVPGPEGRRRRPAHDDQGERGADVGLNHMIHHRGQLTVYLRLNDVPLRDLRAERG